MKSLYCLPGLTAVVINGYVPRLWTAAIGCIERQHRQHLRDGTPVRAFAVQIPRASVTTFRVDLTFKVGSGQNLICV